MTKKLEKIFNAAETAIESMDMDMVGEIDIKFISNVTNNEIVPVEDLEDVESIFELKELKQDFMIAKRNLMKLINHGQNLMDSSTGMDMDDMKASQIVAIAQLSDTIGRQLKMITEMYRDITEIENNRRGPQGLIPQIGTVSGDLNQQVIFAGSTADLLNHLSKKNENI